MAYTECQTALKNKLVTVTGLSSTTVTLAEYGVLDRGNAHAAVLVPAAIGAGRNTGGTYQRLWDILIDLYHAYTTEADSFSGFETLRAAVILAIDNDPNLGGTAGVTDTILTSDGDILTIAHRGSGAETGPVFLTQRLRATVYQDLNAT
jgi:hypothetical protein